MTTSNSDRRTLNLIGMAAILLMVVFYIIEFLGYINFLEWIVLVVIVFVVANFALRRVRKRIQLKQL
jgi:hypothetical protein